MSPVPEAFDRDEIFETIVNPKLDQVLGCNRSDEEIRAMIRKGRLGMDGVYKWFETIIEVYGVEGNLLETRLERPALQSQLRTRLDAERCAHLG